MFSNVISSGITLAKVLSGLSKSINIAKEVIPLYESVKPMIRGAKNLPKILNTLNKSSKENPDFDEARLEVINYGLQLIIGEIPKMFLAIALAFILGVGKYTLITLAI